MQAERDRAVSSERLFEHPAIESALLVILVLLLVWKALLPAWHTLNTDFPNYYVVARLLREGYSIDRIYDWIWLQRIRDHWGIGGEGLIGFAGLTPFSAWPVLPLTVFTALTAKRIWIVLNLIFLAATAELLHCSSTLNRRRVWLITLLAFTPLRTSFLYGQMHILVLLLLVLAYFFLQRERPIACGVCVALSGALKVYPLLFLLYFAWKKQYRLALSTLAATLVLILAGILSFGPHLIHLYAAQILPTSLQAEGVDPYNVHAASAASLLHRLFLYEPTLNPHPLHVSPSAYAILYPLFQVAVFLPVFALLRPSSAPSREKLEWATFLLALLVASPVPSSYHFVVMIPCLVLFVDVMLAHEVMLSQTRYRAATAALLLYVLISPASSNVPPTLPALLFVLLSTGRLWIGLLLLALFVLMLARHHPAPAASAPRTILLCAASAAVLVASIAHWHRHLTSIDEQMAQRLRPPAPTLLSTNPAPIPSGGYLYTAMTAAGYRIFDQNGHPIYTDPDPTHARDQLSFAVTPSGALLIELADETGSNIALVSPGSQPRILLHNAESPALSAEGRTIAFLRERRGLASVWTATFDGITASQPTQAVSDTYQARTISFLPSGELLFTASTPDSRGRLALYAAAPGSGARQISAPGEEIAAAAAAPFTGLVALTRLEHARWQLGYLDPTSGRETLLTHHDCNDYAPTWAGSGTLLYATDCARGYGLTALATVHIGHP